MNLKHINFPLFDGKYLGKANIISEYKHKKREEGAESQQIELIEYFC